MNALSLCKAVLAALLLYWCLCTPVHALSRVEARGAVYDLSIKKWSGIYTPDIPWYWNKAQIKAESAFDTNAQSPVGAKGLGQFMPDTWSNMQSQLRFDGPSTNPSLNIQAHAYYMNYLRSQFKKPRPEVDKHSLALASYNAGLGNILKAQAKAGNTLYWEPTSKALCYVTGKHCVETNTYVDRIWMYIREYEGMYGEYAK